ncbi:MAG: hypothetical protein ACYSW7_08405, partial [Planctomycetota bacterium]
RKRVFGVYLLILRLGRLALRGLFTGSLPTACRDAGSAMSALFRAIVIIPNIPQMFNVKRTFL